MRYKRRIIILIVIIIVLTGLEFSLPGHPHMVRLYDRFVFYPYQAVRNFLFGHLPFSVGDVLYTLAAIAILIGLGRWVYFLIKFKTHKYRLLLSFLHTLIIPGVVYILFVLGWGANYYKPELKKFWGLKIDTAKTIDTGAMANFDRYLVNKLNDEAQHYHPRPIADINKWAKEYYQRYTDCRLKYGGQNAKPSLFGYYMQYFGIQGYYNPFTGEAQIDESLPNYMLPFVVCHEMAHQAGIAAEGDANLLSYVVGTASNDTLFNYSCYFNIWLYAHGQLRRVDSTLAKSISVNLNSLTKAHLDTLRQLRNKYHSELSRYSMELYDSYLRLHQQKEGIRGYNNVTASAEAWERERVVRKDSLIRIP
jgi:hypothetical protein